MRGPKPKSLLELLLSRVTKLESGCWEIDGFKRRGVGFVYSSELRRCIAAPRASWLAHRGPIPPGAAIGQSCGNRACVNPEHLVAEELELGRNRAAKLTADKVRSIRQLAKDGLPTRRLSEVFGVTQANIRFIIRGKTWRDVS